MVGRPSSRRGMGDPQCLTKVLADVTASVMDFHVLARDWILARLGKRPLIVGVNGPQGAGKTTLVRALVPLLEAAGRRAVAVSIDDFYLTNAAQKALASGHSAN